MTRNLYATAIATATSKHPELFHSEERGSGDVLSAGLDSYPSKRVPDFTEIDYYVLWFIPHRRLRPRGPSRVFSSHIRFPKERLPMKCFHPQLAPSSLLMRPWMPSRGRTQFRDETRSCEGVICGLTGSMDSID